MEDLSSRLKQVRTELNLSQTELAEKLDVQQADISRWESGKTTPNFQTLQKYSSLNVNVSWLFSGNGCIFEYKVDGTTYLERRLFYRKSNGTPYEIFAVEEHMDGEVKRRDPHLYEKQLSALISTIWDMKNATEAEGLVSRQA